MNFLDQYDERGFLVLEGFADEASCDRLRARAAELVQQFDPADVVSVFSTHEQNRLTDEYFLTSGDKIRFFFEENAFNRDGTPKYEKERSINKIGHALHDLDPVFNRFSRSEKVKELARSIGLEQSFLLQSMYIFNSRISAARLRVTRTALFFSPNRMTSPVCGSRLKMQRSRMAVSGPFPADIGVD